MCAACQSTVRFSLSQYCAQVASALLWAWILNPQFGLANAILKLVGLPQLGLAERSSVVKAIAE